MRSDERIGMHGELVRALEAHDRWKTTLINHIEAGTTDLEPRIVCRDDRCEVGEWLHKRAGWVYRSSYRFKRVQEKHARFHTEAEKVVALIRAQKLPEARTATESGDYHRASKELINEINLWLVDLAASGSGLRLGASPRF